MTKDGEQVELSSGTQPLTGTRRQNLRKYWSNPYDAGRFYAVHRTQALQKSFPDISSMQAFDYLIVGLTLRFGHYLEIPEVLMHKEVADPGRYEREAANIPGPRLLKMFPALPLSFHALADTNLSLWPAILRPLAALNLHSHRWYLSYHHPHAVKRIRRLAPWIYPEWCARVSEQRIAIRSSDGS